MLNKIFVKKIDWLDEETFEASVKFIVNNKLFTAFSHPCHYVEGKEYIVSDGDILNFLFNV